MDGTDVGRVMTQAIRWTARAWAAVSIAVVIALSVGEGVHPRGRIGWILLLLYPVAVCFGMVVAWWREGLGGGITTASLVLFYALYLGTIGTLPKGSAWLILAAPGFLFLWCWGRSRGTGQSRPS